MDDVKSWYRHQEESRGTLTVSETRKVFTTDQVEAFLRQANLNDQALLVKLACVVCAICSSKEITKMKSLKYGGTLKRSQAQTAFYLQVLLSLHRSKCS